MDLAVSPPRTHTGSECEPLHNPGDYAQACALAGARTEELGAGELRVNVLDGYNPATRWLQSGGTSSPTLRIAFSLLAGILVDSTTVREIFLLRGHDGVVPILSGKNQHPITR